MSVEDCEALAYRDGTGDYSCQWDALRSRCHTPSHQCATITSKEACLADTTDLCHYAESFCGERGHQGRQRCSAERARREGAPLCCRAPCPLTSLTLFTPSPSTLDGNCGASPCGPLLTRDDAAFALQRCADSGSSEIDSLSCSGESLRSGAVNTDSTGGLAVSLSGASTNTLFAVHFVATADPGAWRSALRERPPTPTPFHLACTFFSLHLHNHEPPSAPPPLPPPPPLWPSASLAATKKERPSLMA